MYVAYNNYTNADNYDKYDNDNMVWNEDTKPKAPEPEKRVLKN
jgi:hypothetical protein